MLGIEVAPDLMDRWATWFAPDQQPFLVDADDEALGEKSAVPPEVRDTFELYGLADRGRLVVVSEEAFHELSRQRRSDLVRAQVRRKRSVVPSVRRWEASVGPAVRRQADGHRFVWWPSLLGGCRDEVLSDFVTNGRRPSRHGDVPASVWESAETVLPDAFRLAGTFPSASGPNCFGAVMAAAGVAGAEHAWMMREPFEEWLARSTTPGGDDGKVGTVLVWRSTAGAEHAAVTLGAGWALHKPSQGWMSPTKVLTVAAVMRSSRASGLRVSRRRLV